MLDFERYLYYFDIGGFVMPPLVILTILLWYALGYRLLALQSSTRGPRKTFAKALRKKFSRSSVTARATKEAYDNFKSSNDVKELRLKLDEAFYEYESDIGKYKVTVKTIVAIAPLLGLLGTVDGMIETFDSLGDMALFSSSGGIAGGISKALFTTQMGLVVSIPGLLAGRMLDKKEHEIYKELTQIKDLFCAKKAKELRKGIK